MSTYDWTAIGAEVVPVQHRAEFLAHLRGEFTGQPVPEGGRMGVHWAEPRGVFPQAIGEGFRAAVAQYEISPVLGLSHNLTWTCDQNTRKAGDGEDAEVLPILGVKTDTEAMYFVHHGNIVTPVVIETL